MKKLTLSDLATKIGLAAAVVVKTKRTSKKIIDEIMAQDPSYDDWLVIFLNTSKRSKLHEISINKVIELACSLDDLTYIYDELPVEYSEVVRKKMLNLDKSTKMANGFKHWEEIFLYCYSKKDREQCLANMCIYSKSFDEWAKIIILYESYGFGEEFLDTAELFMADFHPTIYDWIKLYTQLYEDPTDYYDLKVILKIIDGFKLSIDEWSKISLEIEFDEIHTIVINKLKTFF